MATQTVAFTDEHQGLGDLDAVLNGKSAPTLVQPRHEDIGRETCINYFQKTPHASAVRMYPPVRTL
jgi:hypothetical protein